MRIIFSLGFVLFFSIGAQDCSAQDTIDLAEIVISDKRLSNTWKEVARPVQLILDEDIQSAPAYSFEELLSYSSGLDVQQKGVHGIQADLNIRGSTFEQTLILINGIRMNDIQTGHHNFNLPLAPMAVERIEIVKGPAARRYGQNAYAGAVNIITREPKQDRLSMQLSYGEYGTFTLGAMAGIASEKSTHLLQANFAASDGYRYNTDYQKSNIWYKSSRKMNFGELSLQAGYTQKDFGANGFYASPEFQDQYEEVGTSLVAIEADIIKNKWTLNPRVHWRRNHDMYLFVRSNPDLFRNVHTSHQIGAEMNARYHDEWGGTGVGIDVRREHLNSNNLGMRDRTVASIFLEKNISILEERLHFTPGFTWSHFSDFGSFFYPGIDIGYDVGNYSTVFSNIGKTYRTPSFTDLYYMDQANVGNPDLVPEEALAYEIGYRFLNANTNITVSLFRRQSTNLIDWTKSNENDPWKPQNISEINTSGLELQCERSFENIFLQKLGIGYTYLDNQLLGNSAAFSRYALDNLRHQMVLNVKHDFIANKLSHHLIYRYTDRVNLDDFHLLDSRWAYDFSSWQVFASINNVLDTEYRESNLVPMPGRWFRIGASLQVEL